MPPACLSSSWQSAQYIPAFHDCTIGRQCNQEQRYSSGTGDFWVLLQYFSLQTKSVAQIHVSTSQWTFAAWKNQGAKSGKAFKLVVCSLSHLLDCLPCFMTLTNWLSQMSYCYRWIQIWAFCYIIGFWNSIQSAPTIRMGLPVRGRRFHLAAFTQCLRQGLTFGSVIRYFFRRL